MGSIAHFRQAMLDADHLQKLDAFFEEHGGTQPPFDPALKALQAARAKKLPVWWEANTRDEIHRALDLAEEFGTTAVIVGGREAAKVADRLKAAKVPVVLRLDRARGAQGPHRAGIPQEGGRRARRTAPRAGPPQGEVEGTGRHGGRPGQGGGPVRLRHRRDRPARYRPGHPPPGHHRGAEAPTTPWPASPRTPRPSPASTAGWAPSSPASSGT